MKNPSPIHIPLKFARELLLKKNRVKHRACLVEGIRPVLDVLNSGIAPQHVFLNHTVLQSHSIVREALEKLSQDCVTLVTSSDIASISDTSTPQVNFLSYLAKIYCCVFLGCPDFARISNDSIDI
jgi:tRNA G18 (ribose-2'-O)-methylase SpoU